MGNAALGEGQLFEALNLAILHGTPVIFVVLERDASKMPLAQSTAVSIDVIARSLGLQSSTVSDATELGKAVSSARETGAPTLIRVTIQ